MTLDRAAVLSALRPDDVLNHFQIPGRWSGRWLRSRRCGTADHDTLAFGMSDDGKWHCHACNTGGDMLKLIALASKLDMQHDFSAVLDLAGEISGIAESFPRFGGRRTPPTRAPLPTLAPIADRISLAKRRAAWVWDRMCWSADGLRSVADLYLRTERGLDPEKLRAQEDIRDTPMRLDEFDRHAAERAPAAHRQAAAFSVPGVALPVRAIDDGALVDIRVRRFGPADDQPKIVGMMGGVTSGSDSGSARLVGCYGHPTEIPWYPDEERQLAVVVEGAMDYLTALMLWPGAYVLGAVDSGSFALVVRHAAERVAGFPAARLIIVEQNDPPGVHKDGTARLGAADRVINEDVNAALKVATRILGPARVMVLRCGRVPHMKDLNDLVRSGMSHDQIRGMAVG